MKQTRIVLLLLGVFSLQSCLNIVEKLSLNRNGSGTYSITYDMSSMMSGMMRDMILESMEGEEDSPFANAKIDGKIELDTLIDMSSGPLMMEAEGELPAVMQKVKLRLRMSEALSLFTTTMTLDFTDISEVAEFQAAMSEMGESGGGLGGISPVTGLLTISRGTLMRAKSNLAPEDMDSENIEMAKMMMSGATYKVVYEFPRKVKSFDMQGARLVDKKTLEANYSMLDIMEGKVDMSGKIKFK